MRPAVAGVHSQVLQNVAVRIDLAFHAFFRRVRTGETPGYPRLRGRGRYDRITCPPVPVGCRLDAEEKRLRIANVGQVNILLHRPLEGAPKTATITPEQHGAARSSTEQHGAARSSTEQHGQVVRVLCR
jgi:putative transposase